MRTLRSGPGHTRVVGKVLRAVAEQWGALLAVLVVVLLALLVHSGSGGPACSEQPPRAVELGTGCAVLIQ
jgi:hypothetical protein